VTSRGLRLEAFNAAGNPLHPVDGARDDRVLRGALQLAEEFEVGAVVTMSGLPAAPGDSFPAWITTVWPPENLRLLEHQWNVAVDYWGALGAEARRRGVRIAVEMHANQLVYNVPSLLQLRAAAGDAVGANFDPSHLLWMGADPVAAIGALPGAIHHVHAKDTRIEARAAVTSRFEVIPNERPRERAWNYVAVGTGHPDGVAFWSRFVDALATAGYDGPLSIENEDYTLGQRESVALAVDTLRQALPATRGSQ
jgi:sugar phosphate isomerase/epimerase